jgi:diguanylate cyclase (GGDEF)-like protein
MPVIDGLPEAIVTGQRRFGRIAAFGLAVTLLALTAISLLGVTSTRAAAGSVARSTALSEAYGRAAAAVAAEESLERKYRLEPSAEVRARHAAAGARLAAALSDVRARGDASDYALAVAVSGEHAAYAAAIGRMFIAVDQGNTALVLRIDGREVDPVFEAIEKQVDAAADMHAANAADAVTRLRRTEALVFVVTVAGFGVGLALLSTFAVVVVSDQREVLRQSMLNKHRALHDALTGLPNRVLFTERLGQTLALAPRTGRTAAVLLIDLDRFKEVNDTLGHHYGDLLLCQVGPRVGAVLRASDTVARLAGDEFAVLLPDIDEPGVREVADRILASLHASFTLGEFTVDLEASIGVAIASADGQETEEVLRQADIAMYSAKEQHDGIVVYDSDTTVRAPGRLLLLGDLRRALDRPGELLLHYQPKLDPTGERLCGVEALLRWHHPDRGFVPPVEFIPAAENTGLINRLTAHVLALAVGQARAWLDEGHRVPVAVNLSARSLLDATLPARVGELLHTHGVPARLLRLEVTESAIMIDAARSLTVLNGLHDLGIRLSIDDFGTGYSSMAYLKQLPVDEIKIDRSFVIGMVRDHDDAVIVRGAIDLGHNLGLTVVAEGVETSDHVHALTELGCDILQGYHYARPMPPDQLTGWLVTSSTTPQTQPAV